VYRLCDLAQFRADGRNHSAGSPRTWRNRPKARDLRRLRSRGRR
jgi:hypothetical protein